VNVYALIAKLRDIAEEYGDDPEAAHAMADKALLEYIDDESVTVAFDALPKWYA
jgi:hypothetical protein